MKSFIKNLFKIQKRNM